MKKNVGSYDGAVRFVLGCAILFIGHRTENWWALVGFLPMISTFAEYCPVYALLRVNTTACDEREAP